MTDGNTCTCRGYAAMHKPHPHADRDGSEERAQLEREHERALAAYVPEDDAGEVERLRQWKAEAIEVIRGLQELGRALGLRPGEQITGHSATEAAMRLSARAERAEAALAEERALVDRLNRLLGSHADGHRCTCTMVDPGVYHGDNMHPPEWEQDPWCPTHPEADYIRQQYEAMSRRAEKAEAALARVEARVCEWESAPNPAPLLRGLTVVLRNDLDGPDAEAAS